jgi:hypothetical protein
MTAEFDGTNWNFLATLEPGANTLVAIARDWAGNVSSPATLKATYVMLSPLTLVIDPPNGGRVLGVTNGQALEVGKSYVITAVTNKGFVFASWVELENSQMKQSFTMTPDLVLTASFVPNPFPALAGAYHGLFYPSDMNDVAPSNSGAITLTLTGGGLASGKVNLGGTSHSFSGVQFHPTEFSAAFWIQRGRTLPPLQVELQFEGDAWSDLHGLISAIPPGDSPILWTSEVLANHAQANPALAGSYTFTDGSEEGLSFDQDDNPTPPGHGCGNIILDAKGNVKVTGYLADGTSISCSSTLLDGSEWPVYAPLNGGRGMIIGWAGFATDDSQPLLGVVEGRFFWIKAPATSSKEKYYRNGFRCWRSYKGSKYVAPRNLSSLLGWTQGTLTLDWGNLPEIITADVQVQNNKIIFLDNPLKITLNVTLSSGQFNGSFIHPENGKSTSFKGACLQMPEGVQGAGWFLGINEGGAANLWELR